MFFFIFIFNLFVSDFVLSRSSAVGVGFYGNSETNDGVYQLTYSLYGANRTLGSVENLVSERCDAGRLPQPRSVLQDVPLGER